MSITINDQKVVTYFIMVSEGLVEEVVSNQETCIVDEQVKKDEDVGMLVATHALENSPPTLEKLELNKEEASFSFSTHLMDNKTTI